MATAIFKKDNDKSRNTVRRSTPPPKNHTTPIHTGTNRPAAKETYSDTVHNSKNEKAVSVAWVTRLRIARMASAKGRARVMINKIQARYRFGFTMRNRRIMSLAFAGLVFAKHRTSILIHKLP